MPNHPVLAAAAALLALSACATTPAGPTTEAAPAPAAATDATAKASPQPKVICQNETPVGSHLSKRVCRPVEQVERERQATQIDLARPRATPPPAGN